MKDQTSQDTQKFNFNPDKLRELYKMSEEFDPDAVDHLPLHSELTELEFRYNIEALVAQGGVKSIYRAKDVKTDRYIALAQLRKEHTNDKSKREAFLREARLNAALQHPNIMPVYDLGFDENNSPFFSMRLMHGESLETVINDKSHNSHNLSALLTIFIKVCDAISYSHSKGIIHLDLKPDNILLGKYGEVIVADWGISKVISEDLKVNTLHDRNINSAFLNSITATGEIKGTPGYLSPEQIDKKFGKKTEKTDIFALGAILFKILTGHTAIHADTIQSYKKQLLNGIISPSKQYPKLQIDKSLEAISMKAMSVIPANRYSAVSEIIKDLQAFQSGYLPTAETANSLKHLLLFIRRNKVIVTITCLILSSIITFMAQRIQALETEAKLQKEQQKLSSQIKTTKNYMSLTLRKNVGLLANSFNHTSLKSNWERYRFLHKESPDNPVLEFVRFKLYVAELDLKNAAKLISPDIERRNPELVMVVRAYLPKVNATGHLSLNDLLEMITALNMEGMADFSRHLAATAFYRTQSNKIAKIIIRQLIELYNPDVKPNFKLTVDKRGDLYLNVILKGKAITSIRGLQFLPITDLDLFDTGVKGIKVAAQLPLKKLTINRKVTDIRPLLDLESLQTLIIEERLTPRPHISELEAQGVKVIKRIRQD